MKALAVYPLALACLIAGLAMAAAAPAGAGPEDRYVAARDAAIGKLKLIAKNGDNDAAAKAEDAARADLAARMRAILGPLAYAGFGAGELNLDTLSEGDEVSACSMACA